MQVPAGFPGAGEIKSQPSVENHFTTRRRPGNENLPNTVALGTNKEAKRLAFDHTARKGLRQDSRPCMGARAQALPHIHSVTCPGSLPRAGMLSWCHCPGCSVPSLPGWCSVQGLTAWAVPWTPLGVFNKSTNSGDQVQGKSTNSDQVNQNLQGGLGHDSVLRNLPKYF